MDEKYKTWDINILPFSFTKIKLNTIANDGAIKQAKTIKELLLSDTVSEIVNACDADREGENIFRNIILGSNVKFLETVTFSRMWISSTTNDGIQDAFKNRHPLNEYKNLAISAKARAYADYHLGLNSTMAMTSSFKTSSKDIISVGRVQTPTLKMIVDRENEVINFKTKKLYSIKGKFNENSKEFIADYVPNDKEEKNEYEDLSQVNKIISSIKTDDYIVNDVKKIKKNISHKPLFSLSDLQITMSSKYGYSAQNVLNTVQSLYEKYSLVTYPRTNEQHISPERALKCNSSILNSLSEVFDNFINVIRKNEYKIDKKQIIPTQKGIDIIKIFPSDILKSVSLTVDLERKLDDIENGKLTFADCLNYIFKLDKQLIEDIKEASKNDRNKISSNSNKILCKCPFCGSNIIEKEKFYCCENKECNTVIFKNQLERALGLHKITSSAAKDLFLRGKTTNKISGFISKNKKRYSAYLTYKKENNKNNVWISFE